MIQDQDSSSTSAVEILEGRTATRLLLVCDHASPTIPAELGSLGLSDQQLRQHIAWDIGAAEVTRRLAKRLAAPAVLSGISRLVIDCNRALDDPTSIPAVTDGVTVPGNLELTAAQREQRATRWFWPYQSAVADCLDEFARRRVSPAIVSVHSFTPRMTGIDRPWQIGVLWDKDPRIPLPLIRTLTGLGTHVIGDNLPYSGRDPEGYTLEHHAARIGLPHVLLELRQDEIATEQGAEDYAALLQRALEPILADRELYRPALYL